jgi:DNA repair exonuclease SbcCD ATPase subunit
LPSVEDLSIFFPPGSPSTSSSRNAELAHENAALRHELRDLQSRFRILEAERKQETEQLHHDLVASRRTLKVDEEEFSRKTTFLEQRLTQEAKSHKETAETSAQLQRQIESFLNFLSARSGKKVADLREATAVCGDAFVNLSSASEKLASLQDKISELTQETESAQSALHEFRVRNKELSKKLRRFQNAVQPDPEQIAQAKIAKIQRKYECALAELQQEVTHKTAEIETLQTSYKKVRESLSLPPPSIGDTVAASKAIYEARVATVLEELATTKRSLESLQNAKEELESHAADLTNAISTMEEQKENQQQLINAKTEKIEKQHLTILKQRDLLRNLGEQIAAAEAKSADQETTIHELQLEVQIVKRAQVQTVVVDATEVESLHDEIQSKDKVIANLQQLISVQADMDRLVDLKQQQFRAQLLTWDGFLRSTDRFIENLVKEKETVEQDLQQQIDTFSALQQQDVEACQVFLAGVRHWIPESVIPS